MLFIKSYYRLEEVANRWNSAIEDLLYLAEADKLAIALPQELDGRFYYILNPRDFNKTISGNSADSVEVVLVATTLESARHCLMDENGNILSDETIETMPEEDYQAAWRRNEKAKKLHFANRTFTIDNLVITQEELERFEKESQDKLGLRQEYQNPTSITTEPVYKKIAELKPQVRNPEIDSFLRDVYQKCAETANSTPTAQQMLLFVHNNRALFNQVKDTCSKSIVLISGSGINQGTVENWKKGAVKKPQ